MGTTSESTVGGLDWAYESWDFGSCDTGEDCVPFLDHEDEGGVLLTTGYIINVLLFLPLALMDLQVGYHYGGSLGIHCLVWFCLTLLSLLVFLLGCLKRNRQ